MGDRGWPQAASIHLQTVAVCWTVLSVIGMARCSGVYWIPPVSSFLDWVFLMLVFISPQGLDLWRNESDEDNSLEMRHCTELEEGKKRLVHCNTFSVGGQFVSHREILDHLSCWLLRNCCCKRLIKSWSSCSLVGNMEKEESHGTASSVWEDLDDSAHAKMTWSFCRDTCTNPSSADWMLYDSPSPKQRWKVLVSPHIL